MTKLKLAYFVMLLGTFQSSFGQHANKRETFSIPQGKVGLIGYGSLMSKISMERTLGHPYTDKYFTVHIKGYERIWNGFEPNDGILRSTIAYYVMKGDTIYPKRTVFLNIQPSKNKLLNACLIIIDSAELKLFDKRELTYNRLNFNDKVQEFDIVNGNVYAYIAKPEFTAKLVDNIEDNIIFREYVKTVEEEALLLLGEKFRDEYYSTTLPYSPKTLILRWSNKSGHKYDINLCFYGKEKPTP
jgi:hypothetical protein